MTASSVPPPLSVESAASVELLILTCRDGDCVEQWSPAPITKDGRQVDSMPFTFEDRYVASYKAELECFLKVLIDKDDDVAAGSGSKKKSEDARDVCQRGLEEALSVAYVCDAALKSQQTGKEVFLCMPSRS